MDSKAPRALDRTLWSPSSMFSLERERKVVSSSTPNVLVWSLGDFRQVNVTDIATFGTGFSPHSPLGLLPNGRD